jgi:hypothetical protein
MRCLLFIWLLLIGVRAGAQTPCNSDTECPAEGSCEPRPAQPCNTGPDCPEGDSCIAYCATSEECPPGWPCSAPTPTPTPYGTPVHICATSGDLQTVALIGNSYCPATTATPAVNSLVAQRSVVDGAYTTSNALMRFQAPVLQQFTSASVTVQVDSLAQTNDDAGTIAWEYFNWGNPNTTPSEFVSCTDPDSPPGVLAGLPGGWHGCSLGGINTDPTISGTGPYTQTINPATVPDCLVPQGDGLIYMAIQESPTRHSQAADPTGLNKVVISIATPPCLDGYVVNVTATPAPPTPTPGSSHDCSTGADFCVIANSCGAALCGFVAPVCNVLQNCETTPTSVACADELAYFFSGGCDSAPFPMSAGCAAAVQTCGAGDQCNCAAGGPSPTPTPASTVPFCQHAVAPGQSLPHVNWTVQSSAGTVLSPAAHVYTLVSFTLTSKAGAETRLTNSAGDVIAATTSTVTLRATRYGPCVDALFIDANGRVSVGWYTEH